MTSNKQKIIDYYDNCESAYRSFWDLERSLAMHAGYWDETTHNLTEALTKENEVLAKKAGIKQSDVVLDAGCGVGGSAIYLANNFHCKVVGITLSEKQVETARKYAKERCNDPVPEFYAMDFTQTTFPDASFDVIWGIESVCHALDKKAFLKEALRLLKPGGRLIMADGFANLKVLTPKEQEHMAMWLKGWGVDYLATFDSFSKEIVTTGFQRYEYEDVTSHVIPSSKLLYRISFMRIFSKIGEWLGFSKTIHTENFVSCYYQFTTLKQGLWHYGVFFALKK